MNTIDSQTPPDSGFSKRRRRWCSDCFINRACVGLKICLKCYYENLSNGVEIERIEIGEGIREEIYNDYSRNKPYQKRPLAPTPTDYLPGTDGKIAVMEERCRMGYALWHPLDATFEKMFTGR